MAHPPTLVDGVNYQPSDLMPGQLMFGCTRLAATLRVASCSQMWKKANDGPAPENLMRCRGCPIGAAHAGASNPTFHPLRGTTTCSRCHGTDKRLIGQNLCVSCKNREYEWVRGRNAKGKFPTQHPPLRRHRLCVSVGGRPRVLVRDLATGPLELVVEALRDSKARVMVGFGRAGVMRG